MDRMLDIVQVQPHQHGRKSEAMVAMEMRNKNSGNTSGGNVGKNKLPLRPFARVK